MITLELNMMHWSGLTELTYDDYIPLMSVNEDYAALLVGKEAPWTTLNELQRYVSEHPGELRASGTAIGGAWHLALAGWLTSSGLDVDAVNWIGSTGAGPSLQDLMSGGIDLVCCSLPEARTLYEAGEVRALGVMAPERAKGFDAVPTFAEQGVDWSLGGWRGLAGPRGTRPHVVQRLRSAIEKVVSGESRISAGFEIVDGERVPNYQTFPEFMDSQRFNNRFRRQPEFLAFLAETDEKFGELLTSDAMTSVNTEKFSPLAFPGMISVLLAVSLAGIAVNGRFGQGGEERITGDPVGLTGYLRFALVPAAILTYVLLAESVGFLIVTTAITLGMLLALRTRLWLSVVVAIVLVPSIYQVFAHALRVPLPQGWWGW